MGSIPIHCVHEQFQSPRFYGSSRSCSLCYNDRKEDQRPRLLCTALEGLTNDERRDYHPVQASNHARVNVESQTRRRCVKRSSTVPITANSAALAGWLNTTPDEANLDIIHSPHDRRNAGAPLLVADALVCVCGGLSLPGRMSAARCDNHGTDGTGAGTARCDALRWNMRMPPSLKPYQLKRLIIASSKDVRLCSICANRE